MREVAPGDVIFSFCDTLIKAVGLAASHAYEAIGLIEWEEHEMVDAMWDEAPGGRQTAYLDTIGP